MSLNVQFKKLVILPISIFLLFFALTINVTQAQELSKQNMYKPPSLSKDSYIGNIAYNDEDGSMVLSYVEKRPFKVVFKHYTFNKDLQFEHEELEYYSVNEYNKMKHFDWFDYRGEVYTVEGISVNPGWGGKLVVRKKRTTYTYSWIFGGYWPSTKILSIQKLKGDEENRLYMYGRAENYQKGNVTLLVGNKGQKGEVKYQHTKNFQLINISKDAEIEYGEKIEFDHAMCINYFHVIDEPGQPFLEINDTVGDFDRGDLAIVFSPLTNLTIKKHVNPNPNEHTLVIVDKNGKIKKKIELNAPSSGWWIENIVKFSTGEIIAYGPSKDNKYINTLKPTNSPLTYTSKPSNTTWRSFQLLKLNANLEIDYLVTNDLNDFRRKLRTPPSQKRSPSYIGKRFDMQNAMLTPEGEFLLTGQKYTWGEKNVEDDDGNIIETYHYKNFGDLLLFQFDKYGKLKTQYGVRRNKMNKYARRILTPQDLYLGKDDKSVYWVYGEIKGFRKGFTFDIAWETVTVNKRKLLYYPAVAKIELENQKINDFKALGKDARGRQSHFTNPEFPQLFVDNSHLIFIGEDKKGSLLWFGQMELE
ncbi:MAG: hypothetical protein MK212_04090 [Saprospiraceae bacterium]|nr:hypothetical protein [Saprospiraceae bacterium]